MILQKPGFLIPRTSKVEIISRGDINNGDIIKVMSPIFSSIEYVSKDINISKSFEVPVMLKKSTTLTDENCNGTLICEDNDIRNMYVKL